MDFPTKTDHDIIRHLYGDLLMMLAILVDDTYVNLKGVTWVSWTDDKEGLDDVIYVRKGV